MSTGEQTTPGPIQKAITEAIVARLQPLHLEIVNESYMHNVPKGSETHFKVLVVSDKFESLPLIKVCVLTLGAHFTMSFKLLTTSFNFSCLLFSGGRVRSDTGWSTISSRTNWTATLCTLYRSKPKVRRNGTKTIGWSRAQIAEAVSANDTVRWKQHAYIGCTPHTDARRHQHYAIRAAYQIHFNF